MAFPRIKASHSEDMKMKTYYSVEDVAQRYGVGKKIIYALIQGGDLQALKVGKKFLRISETELQRWEAAIQAGEHDGLSK